ncbi:Ger(x)C family spore germination protein [Lysinibacillus sp. BW-2-10]|uniref:Ger(x)C family spore germination protein n=1 Tax=Lysinibacillus sp. BW-2-10 TaxID=2590030 RepID=UPI00117C27E5|nr:Ger(x)C family spore germination protein [Lysinibacillus sp. BW-2-10]TSI06202.1 Ger(x)C family spore germination protein [Lysinibacillus sp. BW-2-10]
MNKRVILISLLFSTYFLTGCWDRYELEERANILGLAIDVMDEEAENFTVPEITYKEENIPDEYKEPIIKLTAQLAVPGKIKLGPEGGGGGDGSEKTAWVVQTVGSSLKDAMTNLQQQLAEKLYLGHLQIIVLNEKVAKRGTEDINDFLKREYEVRRTAWMVVSEDKAEEVLQAAPPIETVPALYLSDTLKNSMRFGKLPREHLGRFWLDIEDIGIDGSIPYITVIENDRIMVSGLAYFKGDKMVGHMTPFEIGAYLAMQGKNPGGYAIAVNTDDGGIYIGESSVRRSDIKINVKDGQPSAQLNVEVEVNIEEETKANDLDNKKVKKIEKEMEKSAVEKFEKTVNKWKENESDVLGIGARTRAEFPHYWDEQVKTDENWSQIFKEMNIEVNVECEIERAGMEWK